MDRYEKLAKILASTHTFTPVESCVCKGCDKCCGAVIPVAEKEIRVLRDLVKNGKAKPKYNGPNRCPFLTDDNECQVYEHRPRMCRAYDCRSQTDKDYYRMMANVGVPRFGGETVRGVDMCLEFLGISEAKNYKADSKTSVAMTTNRAMLELFNWANS